MNEKARRELALFLGDENRNFIIEPLTQDEILQAIQVYSEEIKDENIDPDMRSLYCDCLEVLKKHLFFH